MINLHQRAATSATTLKEMLATFCEHFDEESMDQNLYKALGSATMTLEILAALSSENPLNEDLLTEAISAADEHIEAFQIFLREA